MYPGLLTMQIPIEPQNCGQYLMKTAIKRENAEFLVITLKHVSGVMSHVNFPRTPKLWAIAHETATKHENDEFLVMPLKHVLGLMAYANRRGTPKLWSIGHENGHKREKSEVFGQNCQTCILSYGPCKSPWNPKTLGNS
jgi:hypothetical protein